MYRVEFSLRAMKAFKRIPETWQKRLSRIIESLKSAPYQGKKLQGELAGYYSVRVWPYRIIYQINKKSITIYILDIGHRQGVYR